MRVKISYTMNIDDVPDKACDIIHESMNQLNEAVQLLKRSLSDLDKPSENISHALSALDRARIAMGTADVALQEVQSIMTGLENYYNGEQNVSEGRSIVDPRGNTTTAPESSG